MTREGFLEPWIRLREREKEERERLAEMPRFEVVNRVGRAKPGASVLLHVTDEGGHPHEALVTQRFGKGRCAALPLGDLWRWHLRREDPDESDFAVAWRQTMRWLVSDVPRRLELETLENEDGRTIDLRVRVRDERHAPETEASVRLTIEPPGQEPFELDLQPSEEEAGVFVTRYVPRHEGPHEVDVSVEGKDEEGERTRRGGWVSRLSAREFQDLAVDRAFLADLARRTGGSVVEPDELESFADQLVLADVPITEIELDPLWHRGWLFALAILCLCAEWGLRRSRGLP